MEKKFYVHKEFVPNKFKILGSSRTLLSYTPTYDQDGNETSRDPNCRTTLYENPETGTVYTMLTRSGVTRYFVGALSHTEFNSGDHFKEINNEK